MEEGRGAQERSQALAKEVIALEEKVGGLPMGSPITAGCWGTFEGFSGRIFGVFSGYFGGVFFLVFFPGPLDECLGVYLILW